MNMHTFTSNRIARFGSGATILRQSAPIDMGTLQHAAPSVFAADKHASRSERYTYIPTSEVLTGLQKEGFHPFEVRQGGSRDDEKRGFTKHMLRLRHATDIEKGTGENVRELILLNSHDGTSSYQLMSGVFRIVCTNGLICADGNASMLRIPHKGDIISNVIEGAYTIINEAKLIDSSIDSMKAIDLNPEEQRIYAKAALELRFNPKEDENGLTPLPPIEATQVLQPRRNADTGSDLWRTFNRVQENLIRGDIGYIHHNAAGQRSRRSTRPVNSIDGNISLNRALWTLSTEMQKLKAA